MRRTDIFFVLVILVLAGYCIFLNFQARKNKVDFAVERIKIDNLVRIYRDSISLLTDDVVQLRGQIRAKNHHIRQLMLRNDLINEEIKNLERDYKDTIITDLPKFFRDYFRQFDL